MKKMVLMVLAMGLAVGMTWAAMAAFTPVRAEEHGAVKAEAAAGGEEAVVVQASERNNEFGLLAIGVGMCLLGGAIGTGIAQGAIGTAVVAACAEDKKFLGIGIFLLALPETILVIATGIAYLLLQNIK